MPKNKEKLPLSKTHPKLAREADGWDPSLFTSGSGVKTAWKCKKNHKWIAAIYSRTSKNSNGCPYCAGQKILVGFNDLESTHPKIAGEAYGWDPKKYSKGSATKLKWICPKKHIYETSISTRTGTSKSSCPFCSGNKVLPGFNDLATTHPELAKQAFGWDPRTVASGSDIKRTWICTDKHYWKVSPNSRTSKKLTGCPTCSNKKTLSGFNDLKTLDKNLAKEAYGWDPSLITQYSAKKVKWICKKGHIWEARIYSRTKGKSGCPVCSNQKILIGVNDLATTHPELAKQAFGWDPKTIVAGTKKKLTWKCHLGHIWNTNVELRSKQNTGCPYCTNQKTLPGFNDLKTSHPTLAMEAFEWDPTTLTSGSVRKVKWICKNGHTWLATIKHRTVEESGCPVCSGRITLSGFNDLATQFPYLAKEALGWDPTNISPGSRIKKKWKCENGHIWIAQVSNRAHLARGCPTCAKTGFDPNKTGWLYFLEHDHWQMFQIGITNVPEKRLQSHTSLGWKLIEIKGPLDGYLTQQWESAILRMLKAKGADLSNNKIAGKFDGYSEAWSKSTFAVGSIKDLMRLTEEFEEH